jgi:hypothetical protein
MNLGLKSSHLYKGTAETPKQGPQWVFDYTYDEGFGRDGTWAIAQVDALTGKLVKATSFAKPAISMEEAFRICEGQWVPRYQGRQLVKTYASLEQDSERSPSKGPVWHCHYEYGSPEPGMTPTADVCVDGTTGELLDAPDVTLPTITEIEAVEAGAKALGPRIAGVEWQADVAARAKAWANRPLFLQADTGIKLEVNVKAYWTCDPAKNGVPGPVYRVTGRYWRPESTNECEVTVLIDGLTGEFVRIDDPRALRLLPSKAQ